RSGAAVALESWGDTPTVIFAAPENLEQVQRGSLSLRRKEIPTVPPATLALFLQRWQGRHPEGQIGSPEGLRAALERLQGLSLPRELWEQTVLPARVPGYQPRWLDEATASGEWTWVWQDGASACFQRDILADRSTPIIADAPPLDPIAEAVLESLRGRGALFVSDLA